MWRRLLGQATLRRLPVHRCSPAASRLLTAADPPPHKRPRGRAPNGEIWDELLGLWVEKPDSAAVVASKWLPEGVSSDATGDEDGANELSRQRTKELQQLLEDGERRRAQELFDGLLERGQADERQLWVMLKTRHGSTEQHALIDRATAAGAAITVRTFNMLLGSLLVEGRADGVAQLQAEMARRGIEPDERTAEQLAWPAEAQSRLRTAKLGRLLKDGETSSAWELFDGLLARGHANEYLLTVMLKASRSSSERMALVRRAEEAGVVPGVSTHTMLLGSLLLEGRADEAEQLQAEMARRGLEPNERTAKVLALPAEAQSRRRTAELEQLLKDGEEGKAWELFDGLLARRLANKYHLTVMLKACPTRAEQQALKMRARNRLAIL